MADTTFTITCTMKDRWVPHFLGMLRQMKDLGERGSSRNVTIMSDGDGDFRPKFVWNDDLPNAAEAVSEKGGNTLFDAG